MLRHLHSTSNCAVVAGAAACATLAPVPYLTCGRAASTSYFAAVPRAPPDAIMGIASDFAKDVSSTKVNLCIGVYRDEHGHPFVLESVRKAMAHVVAHDAQMDYAPIAGLSSFVHSAQCLCFGQPTLDIQGDRIASAQTLSGTGALHLGATLLQRYAGGAGTPILHLPNPSYPNHLNIFDHLGFEQRYYPYYNLQTHRLQIDAMLNYLRQLPPHAVVVLHACAHNPTGCDPSPEEWQQIVDVIHRGDLIPFVDMAYQGFATGDIERDAYVLQAINQQEIPTYLVAQSLAKSFGLYGHRIGALHIRCTSPREKVNIFSQLQSMARATYSNPPIFGARVADEILRTPHLCELWKQELQKMASRLQNVRHRLVAQLRECGSTRDWAYLEKGVGMMSLTGLTEDQVLRLQRQYHVYLTRNGRIAFSGLNAENVVYVAGAIHDVSQ